MTPKPEAPKEPPAPQHPLVYDPPRIELVLTQGELAREVQYAGGVSRDGF